MRRLSTCGDRVNPLRSAILILTAIFLITALAATGYAIAVGLPFGLNPQSSNHAFDFTVADHQGISGKIVIANTSPVCQLVGNEPASGPTLAISSGEGRTLQVQLEWTLVDRCALVAEFLVPLQTGTYSVALYPCNYLGCRTLPMQVTVDPGAFTALNVEVSTGIQ